MNTTTTSPTATARAPLPAWASAMDRRLKAEDRHEPPIRSRRRAGQVVAPSAREGQGAAAPSARADADGASSSSCAVDVRDRSDRADRRRSRRKPPQ